MIPHARGNLKFQAPATVRVRGRYDFPWQLERRHTSELLSPECPTVPILSCPFLLPSRKISKRQPWYWGKTTARRQGIINVSQIHHQPLHGPSICNDVVLG